MCEHLLFVNRVVDVSGAESEGWPARSAVFPVVIRVGDAEMALVLVAVAVAVSDQGCFPVIMEVGTGCN